MRSAQLLLVGTALVAPPVALGQSQDRGPVRPRGEAVLEYRSRPDDGPYLRFRYADEDRHAEVLAYRRGIPRVRCGTCVGGRCGDREWRVIERCEAKAAELERRDAEWRREARKREAEFEREMARREREFREKELRRWREHQRKMAELMRDLDRYR